MSRFVAAVCACWMGQAFASIAPLPPGLSPRIAVDTRSGDQTDPHVSGSFVAYTDGDVLSGSAIRFYDLASSSGGSIPSAAGSSDYLSDISQQNIVFSRVDGSGASNIYVYSLSSSSLFPLDVRSGVVRQRASIGGHTVAYEDLSLSVSGFGSEVVRADFTTGVLTQITHDDVNNYSVAVSPDGQVVAWVKCAIGFSTCDVYTEVAGTVTNASNRSGEEKNPDTNGQVVIYSAVRSGSTTGSDIAWVPVGGGAEKKLALAGEDGNPNISGNLVAFEHRAGPSSPADLFLYDLAGQQLFQLTDTPESEELNDIYLEADGTVRVVFSVQEADRNVYAYSFPLAAACHSQAVAPDCDALWDTPADATLTVVRGHGKSTQASAVSQDSQGGAALVCVRTHKQCGGSVSSGRVLLNGVEVVGPSAFNPHVEKISRSVTAVGHDTLSAIIEGAPGSEFTAKLYGSAHLQSCQAAGLSFAPTSDGTSAETIPVAVDQTASNTVTADATVQEAQGCNSAGGSFFGWALLAVLPGMLLRRRHRA